MQKIKIAIIDNGVDEAALGNEISGKVYVNEKKECVYDEADMSRVRFAHGTICAAIIQKYLANSEIYSIRLLNEDGSGLIEHLKPALDWCIEKGIYLVNLSLGTTHFRDKSLIRTLVNHYVSKGMCIVAATSNSGYESYPASFSNIIGVATHSSFFSDSLKRLFLGINILGESEHTLRLYGVASVTGIVITDLKGSEGLNKVVNYPGYGAHFRTQGSGTLTVYGVLTATDSSTGVTYAVGGEQINGLYYSPAWEANNTSANAIRRGTGTTDSSGKFEIDISLPPGIGVYSYYGSTSTHYFDICGVSVSPSDDSSMNCKELNTFKTTSELMRMLLRQNRH